MLRLRGWSFSWSTVRKIAVVVVIVAGITLLFLWRLGDLTAGLSPAENSARHSSSTWQAINVYPLNTPQRLMQYGLQSLNHHGAFWMRLPSVTLAVVFLGLFYMLTRSLFGLVIGSLATIILATTPWIILLARSATADILLLSPVAILLVYGWLKRTKPQHLDWAWLLLVILSALSLYVPGLIWLIAVGGVMARKPLLAAAKTVKQRNIIISGVVALILISILAIRLAGNLTLAKAIFLLPNHWVGVVATIKNIAWAALSLVWRTPYHIGIIIDRVAILDAAQIVLAIFGAYAMWVKARRELYILASLIALGIVGAGINRNLLLLTLALPAIVVLIAAGLRYLYVEWRSVFPHNPIPRTLSIVIMFALVSLQVLYGVRYSLVAWPHTIATRQTYVIK